MKTVAEARVELGLGRGAGVVKFNPYHDEAGRFTDADHSVGPGSGDQVAENGNSPTMTDAAGGVSPKAVAIGGPMFEAPPPDPPKSDYAPHDEETAPAAPPAPPPGSTAAIAAPNGTLPGVSPGKSAGWRNMAPSDDPNAAALAYVQSLYSGRTPISVTPIGNLDAGAFYATMSDGSVITYRPAGASSERTPTGMATVEINDPWINAQNGEHPLKLKFPTK